MNKRHRQKLLPLENQGWRLVSDGFVWNAVKEFGSDFMSVDVAKGKYVLSFRDVDRCVMLFCSLEEISEFVSLVEEAQRRLQKSVA